MSLMMDHHDLAKMLRYSDGEKQRVLSNESQDEEITKGVLYENPSAKFHFTFASAHSGTDPDRNQLEDAFKKLKAFNRRAPRPVTCLILWRWDRWFRNAFSSVRWVERFRSIGVEVNTVERWINFDHDTDKMLFFLEQSAAEKVSNDISAHTKRSQAACLRRGYMPHRISRRYQDRIETPAGKKIVWLPAADNLRKAGIAVIAGSGIKEAWLANGGREVLGALQTFRDQLSNEHNQARRGEHRLDFAPLWLEADYIRLQKRLRGMKVLTKNLKSLSDNFMRRLLFGSPCNAPATSSPVRNGSGKKTHYYVCNCKGLTHYRFRRDEVHGRLREMIKELSYNAVGQLRLSRKAEKRSKEQVKNLKSELARKKRALTDAEKMSKEAVKALLRKEITFKEKQEISDEVLKLQAEIVETEGMVKRHGEILSHVLQSIAGIGAVISTVESNLQLRDFIRMAFPEGLQYLPESRTFRAPRTNAALSTIDANSASYSLLKIGVAAETTTPKALIQQKQSESKMLAEADTPVLGERPVNNRTVKEDIVALRAYCEKYQIA